MIPCQFCGAPCENSSVCEDCAVDVDKQESRKSKGEDFIDTTDGQDGVEWDPSAHKYRYIQDDQPF